MSFTGTCLRWCAATLSRRAADILRPMQPDFAAAMRSETDYVGSDWAALAWSLGCLRFACAERARSRHPLLFRVGVTVPLALWRLGTMLVFGWLGVLSAFGLVGKALHPESVGLWLDLPLGSQHRYEASSDGLLPVRVGHDHVVFGLAYHGTGAIEVLGSWFFVLMAALLFVAVWGSRRNFLAARRALRSG